MRNRFLTFYPQGCRVSQQITAASTAFSTGPSARNHASAAKNQRARVWYERCKMGYSVGGRSGPLEVKSRPRSRTDDRRNGGQAKNFEQVGALGRGKPSSTTIETLRASARDDSDGLRAKAESGGDVKAPPSRRERAPGGGGPTRVRTEAAAKHRSSGTGALARTEALRAGRHDVEPTGNRRQRKVANDERAGGRRRGVRAVREEHLEGEPWTWQRGEINPQGRRRMKPSRACETPRREGGGCGNPP